MNQLKYNYHSPRDIEILNQIEHTIKKCIELLSIDGQDTKSVVKAKLQELIIDKEWVARC